MIGLLRIQPQETETLTNLPSRNDPLGFAKRTLRNLTVIEKRYENDPSSEAHVVTQITLSLLGLLVYPYERLNELKSPIFAKTLTEAANEGWLGFRITIDNRYRPTKTIADLVKHLRHAVAHSRLTFLNDSRKLSEEVLTFENGSRLNPTFRAEIKGDDLRCFCLKFLGLVERAMK